MIMMYDGCKTLFLESTDEEHLLTLEDVGVLKLKQAVVPMIVMDYINVADAKGGLASGVIKPYSVDPADSYVVMDFSNLKIVWAKDVAKADVDNLGLRDNFLIPIWNKFKKLRAEQKAAEEAKLNDLITKKVNELIDKASAQPAPETPTNTSSDTNAAMSNIAGTTTMPLMEAGNFSE